MAKYHVNAAGEAGPCKATQGGCPFGGEENHYSTPEEARAAYERTATKKKGLFSIFKRSKPKHEVVEDAAIEEPKPAVRKPIIAVREPNPVAVKDRRSTDGALDMRRFKGLLDIAKKGKWDVMEDGTLLRASGDKQNTFEALSQLQREDRDGGNAFEQADRLKEAYAKLRDAGEVEAPSYGPEVVSRDMYLRMVAPATHDAVSTIENELQKAGWDVRAKPNQVDSNQKTFSKLMKLDMTDAEGREEAAKALKAEGWYLEDDEDTLAAAIAKGQAKAATYGSRFKYEQEYLF